MPPVDFSMINSLPYNDYSAGHDVWGVKTTLRNWGYYYALGYSLGGRLDLRYGGLRTEARDSITSVSIPSRGSTVSRMTP